MGLNERLARLEAQYDHLRELLRLIVYLPDFEGQPLAQQRREVYTVSPGSGLELAAGDLPIGPDTKTYVNLDFERI